MAYRSTSPGQPVGKVGGRTYGDTSNILSSLYGGAQFYYLPGDRVDASFSRSSDAAFRDDGKTLVTAGSGVIRDKHYVRDENGFLVRATRLEASRTNRYTRSEDLSHGDWTKTNVSITTDDADGADGSTTADKVVENNDSANEHLVTQSLPTSNISDDTDQTASCHGVDAERKWLAIRTTDQNGDTATSWVDLSDGSTGTVASAHTIRVETDWNGLVRPAVTFDSDSGGTTPTVEWIVADADGSTSYDGDGSSGLHLWGFQFEADSSFPSSYIATAGSSVSRAADSLSTGINFGPQEMTVYAKFVERGTALASSSMRIAQVGDNPNEHFILWGSGGGYQARHDNASSVTQTATVGSSVSFGEPVELRGVLQSDGGAVVGVSINGASEETASKASQGALASSFSDPTVYIGKDHTTANNGFADFLAVLIAPGVRTMSEMRGLV